MKKQKTKTKLKEIVNSEHEAGKNVCACCSNNHERLANKTRQLIKTNNTQVEVIRTLVADLDELQSMIEKYRKNWTA